MGIEIRPNFIKFQLTPEAAAEAMRTAKESVTWR